jgi:hypothetical protein
MRTGLTPSASTLDCIASTLAADDSAGREQREGTCCGSRAPCDRARPCRALLASRPAAVSSPPPFAPATTEAPTSGGCARRGPLQHPFLRPTLQTVAIQLNVGHGFPPFLTALPDWPFLTGTGRRVSPASCRARRCAPGVGHWSAQRCTANETADCAQLEVSSPTYYSPSPTTRSRLLRVDAAVPAPPFAPTFAR